MVLNPEKTRLTRRQFITQLSALGLLPLFSGCEAIFSKPLSIAAHAWPGYEFMFLAMRENWLDKNQVALIETRSATDSLQKLKAGQADGAALTMDEILTARSEGVALSIVSIFNISAGADMLLAFPGINLLTDIKGKRIGVEEGSVSSLILHKALEAADLSSTDIIKVPLTIADHLDAWKNQQVDALVTYEPVASQLLADGAVKLFDSRSTPNLIVDALAVRTDRLKVSYRQAIMHLIEAHFKGLYHLNTNPQDASYRMAKHLNLPPKNVLNAYKGLVLPDLINNHRLLSGNKPVLLESATHLNKVLLQIGKINRSDTLNNLIDSSFLPTIL
ncbi:ABC transporter substrate-binding protein [Methylicorpusculum sp.]|uniref:ABC transporter substrate-binding protein n=1 Tax=Methylicorpusculum sp. TaxID=2713644 RepID=UPI00272570B2|nr:ABC transporter substrate-binding protein [Methylicorpusculum sp.]MDO8845762.1 ABC transporter substrate-binding protein [Methylicorpusculum sp.]